MTSRSKTTTALAVLFGGSAVLHFARPAVYERIVPKALPRKRELVYASGVAELVCAAGLLHPRTRRLAGWASAALLVAIVPGNVQMSANHAKRAQRKQTTGAKAMFAGTVARLPLQIPLIRTALRAAGR